MRKTLTALGVVAAGLALTTSAAAHHAFAAEFDRNTPVQIKGKVTQMEWVNPHAWIHIDVVNEDGEVESWMVEGGSPNIMLRRGFTRDSLLPGTEIEVRGYRALNGMNRANGSQITFTDGSRLFLGGSNPDDPTNQGN
jgi:hypothetical protein